MKPFLSILFVFSFLNQSFSQVLSKWTFESIALSATASTAPSLSSGSVTANDGALKSGTEFSGFHTSTSTWSNPQGNGSTQGLSATKWAANDYFQFKASTKGYKNLTIKFDVTGSDTGPRDFKLQYSTDNISYTDAQGGTYTVANDTWNGSVKSSSARTISLTSVSGLNDKDFIYIRLVVVGTTSVSGGSVGTSGTSRIDNFSIEAETTLPVSLASFNALRSAKEVNLLWKTNAESNLTSFQLEKSKDGKSFQTINTVTGKGSISKGASYSLSDFDISESTVYYQLKMNDKDGTSSLSDVLAVKNNPGNDLKLDIQQLGQTAAKVLITSAKAGEGQLSLLDINGARLYSKLVKLNEGLSSFDVSLNLDGKVVIVNLSAGEGKISKKFLLK